MLRISATGAQGDGIGWFEGKPVFVPLTTAGDLVDVEITGPKAEGFAARLVELREAGSGRVRPPCGHFGECGGCTVQHLDDASYAGWKSGLLPAALARRGLADVELRTLIRIPPGTRRRAALAALRRGRRLLLGFHARAEHRVVDLAQCLVLEPALLALLEPLRTALLDVLPHGGAAELLLVATETGVDLRIAAGFEPGLAARQALVELAETRDLARISWSRVGGPDAAEPIAVRRAPLVRFAGVAVIPPPGPFLQPSVAGEAALTAAVREAVGDARRIADLYAGCGTFSLPLAVGGARVSAFDAAGPAVAALQAAARQGGLGAQVAAARRDLDDRPLIGSELDAFDAVLFDPPRAGARAQCEALAASRAPRVVAVSCNPATFARDARILVDGGYRIGWIQPVDQFPWTAHLELVAAFSR